MDELRQMQVKNKAPPKHVKSPFRQQPYPDLTDDTDFDRLPTQIDVRMNKTQNWQPPPKHLERNYEVPVDFDHLP